jgi:uncharacterized protein
MSPTDFVIAVETNASGGRYTARAVGIDAEAELTWRNVGSDTRIAAHTGVPDAFRGKGVGRMLVIRMVEDARNQGFKIVPRCSYVEAERRKHPEWADAFTT